MGINGLLPFLEKATKPVNISQYSGCTVAVDTYCWLHKGAFSCAEKLARGEQTDQYVVYCMKFVNMLLSHNIKPILVFDGRHLPAKAETEKVRKERRDTNRKKAAELLRADRVDEARSLIRRCVDVTHEMASALMERCHNAGVDCIVAPYEADAQLAYFSLTGVAQLIITEDSDLLLFGCTKVLFKMDPCGNGLLVDQSLISLAMKQPLDQFSLDKFRYMCILSGCDYLQSLPGIGLAKACKFIKRTADDNICRALSRLGAYLNMNNLMVTQEYKDKFMVAVSMFKYQPVYDPFKRCLTTLTPLPEGERLPIDEGLSPETSLQLALGNLNPFTLVKTNKWNPDDSKNIKTTGWNAPIRNSIWCKDYQATKQLISKKAQPMFDKFITRNEKQKCPATRKNFIEETVSPKKNNIEEELNHLRTVYGITSSIEKNDSLEVTNDLEESVLDQTVMNVEDNDVDIDDLFDEIDTCEKQSKERNKNNTRNPFAKNSIANKTHLTPLCGALAKMTKLSTPINETNGEVSRYFSSRYNEKEIPIKETAPNQPSASPTKADNPLKDIINTPEKMKSPITSQKKSDTPTTTRRNIFSTSPTKKQNMTEIITTNKASPGRPSFLGMLDSMVSPIREEDKKLKTPAPLPPKKQTVLAFPEISSTLSSGGIADNAEEDMENAEPVKVTAFLKAMPNSVGALHTKVGSQQSSKLLTTPKTSISHKLGPAKTVGIELLICGWFCNSDFIRQHVFFYY
uniref:Exonuclease 1 n=1 Tax=Panstrongylus lignarius TaxID=156445 RepID=A0A224X834_9HEMI